MAELEDDFARARVALTQPASERRAALLRQLGWTTLQGRGGRARRLRAAPLDLGEGEGHPFAPPSHRPAGAIPGRTVLTFLFVAQHFLEHLRRDCPPAHRADHLRGAPNWMWAAYGDAAAALQASDRRAATDPVAADPRWTAAKDRLARELVAQQLGRHERTLRRHERAYWAAP